MEARKVAFLAVVLAVPQCEFDVAGSICLNGGQQVVLPPAVPDGLVGHWTFESRPHDNSGHMNDAEGEVLPGPPRIGNGASGLFEQNFLLVPNAATLPAESFTYTFWMLRGHHAKEAVSESWCPLVSKGSLGTGAAPAILISPLTGQLKVAVATGKVAAVEQFVSHAELPKHQWIHVAVTFHAQTRHLQLYLDGVPDAGIQASDSVSLNEFPLYIGGDPYTNNGCFLRLALDDVKAFARPLDMGEIRAEAGATTGAGVALGCASCTGTEATACPPTFHLCSGLELHTGALQMALRLGWWKSGSPVWTNADAQAAHAHQSPTKKLALCCESEEDSEGLVAAA